MKIEDLKLIKNIFEAALMAYEKPLKRNDLKALFEEEEIPDDDLIDAALDELSEEAQGRGYELKKVASGYRYQVRQELSPWVSKLWKEKTPRYSRALLETLSLIAYRQPITRGEIEDVRGVAVSSQIVRTLLEREWIKVVGHREVPGRPAIYATTKLFLDYFNLSSLDQLPTLAEIRDLSTIGKELNIELPLELVEQEVSEEAIEEAATQEESEMTEISVAAEASDEMLEQSEQLFGSDEQQLGVVEDESSKAAETAEAEDISSDPYLTLVADNTASMLTEEVEVEAESDAQSKDITLESDVLQDMIEREFDVTEEVADKIQKDETESEKESG